MISAVVVVANDHGVFDLTCQPFGDYVVDIAGTAAYYLDFVGTEDVDRALAHVTGEHDFYAHLGKDRGDVGLATATFGRSHVLFADNVVVAVQSDDGVMVAMSEMVVDLAVTGRKCNFHI